MSRRPSYYIKSRPTRLSQICYINAVLSSISFVAGNFPVMWTQSSDALHATCLVGICGGWPMVFHSFCEMSVMFKVVFICNQTEWPFSFTNIFLVWLGLGEKGYHQTVSMCFSLLSVFVMWLLMCYFVLQWGAESLFISLQFALMTAVCLEWTLSSEMPATTIPASRWRLFMCWAWWHRVQLYLKGVDCGCCCWNWLLYDV